MTIATRCLEGRGFLQDGELGGGQVTDLITAEPRTLNAEALVFL